MAPQNTLGYARFRATPGVSQRYPGHDAGRWYPVVARNEAAEEPVPPDGYVWLDMGMIRGVRKEDLEFSERVPAS